MAKKTRGQVEEAQIDMTPMLDVTFIMLIFFITTSSFVKEAGVEVNKPIASLTEARPEANVLVAVDSNNKVWMNKQQIEPAAVRQALESLRAENPTGAVVVQADKRSGVGVVIQVYDQIKAAGVQDVSVAAVLE